MQMKNPLLLPNTYSNINKATANQFAYKCICWLKYIALHLESHLALDYDE